MKTTMFAALAGLALASAAQATVTTGAYYQFQRGSAAAINAESTIDKNPAAGLLSAVDARYSPASNRFSWDVSFSDGVSKDTDGYWLVVGPGPNPKNSTFEYAIIYFDASASLANPAVSIYRYNGANDTSSFTSPGQLLATTRQAGQTTIAASGSTSGGTRSFNLDVDASTINGLFGPPAQPDWQGIRFGEKKNTNGSTSITNQIGIWFHPVGGLATTYSGNNLTGFNFARGGYYDGSGTPTTFVIPAPASAALIGLAGLTAIRRRRIA